MYEGLGSCAPTITPHVPRVDVVIVEVPSEDRPFGAKGVGEPPVIPGAAAIANAIADATGVRVTSLPITPARLLEALATPGGFSPGASDTTGHGGQAGVAAADGKG